MTRGKEDSLVLHTVSECCMCGDLGLSCEIFRCKLCHFRSQHRYCSNLYPKAAIYDVCNWCLIQDFKEKPLQNSISLPSSACRNYCKDVTGLSKKIKKIQGEIKKEVSRNCTGFITTMKKSSSDHQLQAEGVIFKKEGSRNCNGFVTKMKKSSSDHQLQAKGVIFKKESAPPIRKRIFTKGQLEEMIKLRRTKSDEMPNEILPKYSSRNRVRRYKLLDEVSS